MIINMHLHWIMVIVLLIGTFIANHYFLLDDESRLRAFAFDSLLLVTFIASGGYLYRVFAKLPQWDWVELIGLVTSAGVFLLVSWTYWVGWRSRGRMR